ncbi:hypothetical protein AALP_AA2G069100 [Arabis alpina]|uniref:Uncharacterized protein n=1 Tax=Arabis alpina TaxID=50452 RepID=A0A087HFS3_ARAAL|nr:hypothetical protein AALP_AA2G069100 [Arabis alpina]
MKLKKLRYDIVYPTTGLGRRRGFVYTFFLAFTFRFRSDFKFYGQMSSSFVRICLSD